MNSNIPVTYALKLKTDPNTTAKEKELGEALEILARNSRDQAAEIQRLKTELENVKNWAKGMR